MTISMPKMVENEKVSINGQTKVGYPELICSSIDQPDIPILVQILRLDGLLLIKEDLKSRHRLVFINEKLD